MLTRATHFDRRRTIAGAASIIALATTGGATAARPSPVAETSYGKVRGRMNGRGYVFQGIPYGHSTEARRFQPGVPPPPWKGVRDAVAFGDQCPQVGPEWPKIYASWLNPRPETEDCLNLNVYTPALRDGRARPVMVWFHGGGFTFGSSAMKYAEGTRLSQRGDVVVVTVNHRLNGFGFLYLGHLVPGLADSGNAGVIDMVQALAWVRDNIAEFGGDPGNVTIFGQSGGGGKVSVLMATPSAKGLFHKAIVQSGSALRGVNLEHAMRATAQVLQTLGVPSGDAAQLPQMDRGRLHAAFQKSGVDFRPVVDERTLPRHPFEPMAPAVSKDVPLLVGSTKDETTGTLGGYDVDLFTLSWDTLPVRLAASIPQMEPAPCIETLRRSYPQATASDIFFMATTEVQFRRRAILQAERKHELGGAPVFMYRYAWESPRDGGRWKAPHSSEHPMVWDNVASSESMIGPTEPSMQRMADVVSTAWISFARGGNPGWTPFNPTSRLTMVFDRDSRLVSDPAPELRLLFSGLPAS